MSNIKLLDCTLRDGGYINDWKFGKKEISEICRCLTEAKIDIIELGFLTDLPHTADYSLYSNTEEIDKACPEKKQSLLAAMIALGEKEMDPSSLPEAADSNLDIVRITFHRDEKEINRAVKYAQCLTAKGYKVCMQPVGTTAYTDKQLLQLIEIINELNPYAFYLVDTLGILCKDELVRFIYLIDYNLNKGIKLGFHSHNNLQMSFANAQQILECYSKREFIVDCSVYGMGRGAGNLCTELIANYTNSIGASQYNLVPVLEALDDYIYPIYLKASWGYSPHYYIAATHCCHPNYAAYLMNKQTLTMNQVDYLLKNIPIENRYIFNRRVIHDLYYNFQSKKVDDVKSTAALAEILKGRNILVLAPGHSIYDSYENIQKYIDEKNPIVISLNASFKGYKSDFVFFSNQKRLYGYESVDSQKLILTSNLSNISNDSYYVNYSRICGKNRSEADNSGVMLLRLLEQLEVKNVAVAGYDGFGGTAKYSYKSNLSQTNYLNTEKKNEAIAMQLSEIMDNMHIEFLTHSLYLEIIKGFGKNYD